MAATHPIPPGLPLADLHRHLDGSLRRATLMELAEAAGVSVDPQLRFSRGMGLAAALACFDQTLSVLQHPDAVRRVAAEICEDAAREGVTTLEIRFAPQLHRGAPFEAVLEAAVDGAAGRAGIVVCALFGEDPGEVERRFEAAGGMRGVVGVDLAGGPSPTHRWDMAAYAKAFTRARDLGLGRTVHAGEGRPPAEIRLAIEALHAQRIGHGTTILQDDAVVDLALARGVVLEACVTSNVQTAVIDRAEDHPLPRWLRRGLRACVCTDNTLLSDIDAPEELRRVAAIPGMGEAELRAVVEAGHAGAFPMR